jgi:hypothetical protein
MKHVRGISRSPRPRRAQDSPEYTPLEQLLLFLTKGAGVKFL